MPAQRLKYTTSATRDDDPVFQICSCIDGIGATFEVSGGGRHGGNDGAIPAARDGPIQIYAESVVSRRVNALGNGCGVGRKGSDFFILWTFSFSPF